MKNIRILTLALTFITPLTQAEDKEVISEERLTECTAVTLWAVAGNSLNNGNIPSKTVKVPKGWEVVGAGATNGQPSATQCK